MTDSRAKVFGKDGASTFHGGFAITNDYFGQRLALGFDGNNTLGLTHFFHFGEHLQCVDQSRATIHWTGNGYSLIAQNRRSWRFDFPEATAAG